MNSNDGRDPFPLDDLDQDREDWHYNETDNTKPEETDDENND